MSANHTKGPWKHTGGVNDPLVYCADGNICSVVLCGPKDAEGQANRNLIAAAPDLLAACEAVLQGADDGGDHPWIPGGSWHRIAGVLNAAIAKAKGGAA